MFEHTNDTPSLLPANDDRSKIMSATKDRTRDIDDLHILAHYAKSWTTEVIKILLPYYAFV